jgi:predicted esterase
MGHRTWFVILSLVACRGPAEGPEAASSLQEATAPNVASTSAPSADAVTTSGPDAVQSSQGSPEPRRRLRLMEHRGPATSKILYRVVEPDDAHASTPVVVALHGRGDTAAGFVGLARRLELDARVIVAEASLPFGNIGGRQWFDAASAEATQQVRTRLDELDELLTELATKYPSAGKPGLVGFSQGAMLGLMAAAERPDRYRSVVALSGRLMDGVAGVAGDGPAILVVAGTKDGIIPQSDSWAAANTLEGLGRKVERFSFQGAHSVPPSAIDQVGRFFDRTMASPRTTPAKVP